MGCVSHVPLRHQTISTLVCPPLVSLFVQLHQFPSELGAGLQTLQKAQAHSHTNKTLPKPKPTIPRGVTLKKSIHHAQVIMNILGGLQDPLQRFVTFLDYMELQVYKKPETLHKKYRCFRCLTLGGKSQSPFRNKIISMNDSMNINVCRCIICQFQVHTTVLLALEIPCNRI